MRIQPDLLPGKSYPLGATVTSAGVNFSLYSKHATAVELLLFDPLGPQQPRYSFLLHPKQNKTFYYWHAFLPGIWTGYLYGYRVHGPVELDRGMRFDGNKLLLDPYAQAVNLTDYDREAARQPGDNVASAPKGVIVDTHFYDWGDDQPLAHPFDQSVIYELHVAGFTKHPNSNLPDHERGTYQGLIHKIPYLKQLGVTAVELMPVQQFDPYDAPAGQINYWGYSPMAFFAVHQGYSCHEDPHATLDEFRDMVKALHQAGIEVILDVVFNHTAEGDQTGPTLSMRGLENNTYYLLPPNGKGGYFNYSGTGNTLNANHSIVRRLIRDCLRYWVAEFHIDGFRFDLASVLSRDGNGQPLENPPLLWEIESDPVLASTKIIAEAWDIEQYQLGQFVGDRWAEWNGKYRDHVRSFVKGDPGYVGALAGRLMGSPDLFRTEDRNPNRSINFVTCHDGFTLNDLVSYNEKHNAANREGNRDGHNDNRSWNCGAEGPSVDPDVENLRQRQIRNFLAILLLSQGTPMLTMGDEVRRTQKGNNNAYCQDNEISWFDWSLMNTQRPLLEFVRGLVHFNLNSPYFHESRYWGSSETQLIWHGVEPGQPDWSAASTTLAFQLFNPFYDHELCVIMNAFWEPLTFTLPPPQRAAHLPWQRLIDTAAPSPDDFHPAPAAPYLLEGKLTVQPRAVVVLEARLPAEPLAVKKKKA